MIDDAGNHCIALLGQMFTYFFSLLAVAVVVVVVEM